MSDAFDEPLVLSRFGVGYQRVLLLVAGLCAVVLPAYELRHAFTQLGWWTIFFGIIVLGAWSVGFAMLYGAVLSEELAWRFDGAVLTLERTTPLSRRVESLTGRDFVATRIREIEWDSRAPTYSVIVERTNGEVLETPDRQSRASAEALEAEIRRRLGMTSN